MNRLCRPNYLTKTRLSLFTQILAGLGEVRRNNVFGYTAFCLYGGFWMSVGTIEIVTLLATESPPTNKFASEGMLFMVSVFTFMLWTLTFKMNYTISSLFFLLGSTCMLLSFGVRNEDVDRVGGWFGVATSVNAFVSFRRTCLRRKTVVDARVLTNFRSLVQWLAYAELVNDVWGEGKEVIPLGHWTGNPFRNVGGIHFPGFTHGHRPNSTHPAAADQEQAPPV